MAAGERQSRRKWLVPWWRPGRLRAVSAVAALVAVRVASVVVAPLERSRRRLVSQAEPVSAC